ncbi:Flagellar motor switch protein FliG [Jannaschia aquimarina]|uniref:Flagellar motor switch protein FliG n=1 Tax=Jannaschia aquimarina TaxID=935700 RepID=A0A0D1EE92_9RHOB|nr:Flagellar motor switch protein FliG [Jannaschia aquimarina]SNT00214.1 flagellar motor switch protein FliG [Jannaschia aquimarina]
MIVHLLLSEGADPGVSDLPPDLQRLLTRALGDLRFVDRATLAAVTAEFATEIDQLGVRFPADLGEALTALDGRLAPEVVEDLISELPDEGSVSGNATWNSLGELPPDRLLALMAGETPEVCAVLLSQLPSLLSADLMQKMGPDRASEVMIAFDTTGAVPPHTVAQIGRALGRSAASTAPKAFDLPAEIRGGAILNASTSGARADLLDRLDAAAPEFAARLRAAVFSWENIPDRLEKRDVPRVMRDVPNETVLAAIGNEADGPVATFLFSAITERLSQQMRDELEEKGAIDPEEAEVAQRDFAAKIRELEDAGELTLLPAPES